MKSYTCLELTTKYYKNTMDAKSNEQLAIKYVSLKISFEDLTVM